MRAWVPEKWRPDRWIRLVCEVLSWRIQSRAGFLFLSTFQWRAWDLKKNVRNAGAGPDGAELFSPLKAMMNREHSSSLFPKGVPRSYSSLPSLKSPEYHHGRRCPLRLNPVYFPMVGRLLRVYSPLVLTTPVCFGAAEFLIRFWRSSISFFKKVLD